MTGHAALTRRDFLRLTGLSLAALFAAQGLAPWQPEAAPLPMAGRVTSKSVPVYEWADQKSRLLRKVLRDDVLPLLEEVRSPSGPAHNPRWYRLEEGFVHSAHIQRVDGGHLNPPLAEVPAGGQLGEVTVPYTQTMYKTRKGQWMPMYRLYFGSVHWITGLTESPGGQPWYELVDEWLKVRYYVPAEHLRPVPAEELSPLAPDVPPEEKRIVVSLTGQHLVAYEGDQVVRETQISTGKRWMETPAGDFRIDRKHPSKHMGDGGLNSSLTAYELPGVPWTSFFHKAGIAFHGTYWHDNFGLPMSRGCVNLRNEDALWIFRWTSPHFNPHPQNHSGWKVLGEGTRVVVD